MAQLKGSVTKVERMDVEVSASEIRSAAIKEFTVYELFYMAYEAWLKERGLGTDVKLKQTSSGKYYFDEYENHGSHYSGYYERPDAYREGDEEVFNGFRNMLEILK